MTYYVYRVYDISDRLLYIGCTSNPGGRLQVHMSSPGNPSSAYLMGRAARWVWGEPIKGELAARAEEKRAIWAEAPLLNVHYNVGRGLRGAALAAEYERTSTQDVAVLERQGYYADFGEWPGCQPARMTPEEAGREIALTWPPITDAQALEAARILAGGAS